MDMKNCDLLIHALFTASVDAPLSIDASNTIRNRFSPIHFFHTAFPAVEEEIIMMIVIINAAFGWTKK